MIRKNSLLDAVGEGEGGMIWENGIDLCMTLPLPPLSSMHNLRYKTTLENKVCLFVHRKKKKKKKIERKNWAGISFDP